MQDFCHFFAAGYQAHVLLGDHPHGDHAHHIHDHRRQNGQGRAGCHTEIALRAQEAACQAVDWLIVMQNGTKMPMDDILNIEGEIFASLQ